MATARMRNRDRIPNRHYHAPITWVFDTARIWGVDAQRLAYTMDTGNPPSRCEWRRARNIETAMRRRDRRKR